MGVPNPYRSPAEITRRGFILAASVSLLCAPSIVRAGSLMPIRAIGPVEPPYYGFVHRWFINGVTPHLSELHQAGMSAHGIAGELNRRNVGAMNGVPWKPDSVISATKLMKMFNPGWRDWPKGSLKRASLEFPQWQREADGGGN